MSNFKEVYQKFINLAIAAEQLSDTHKLDPIEKRILHILSTYWSTSNTITVSESLKRINEFSASTTFKYIKQLREKGYIQLKLDKVDNRVKYLMPTSLTDDFFSDHGKHIIAAASIDINDNNASRIAK